MHRIELDKFLIIAEHHSGFTARQLRGQSHGIALASAALAAPFAGFGDVELHPAFHAKAAIHFTLVLSISVPKARLISAPA